MRTFLVSLCARKDGMRQQRATLARPFFRGLVCILAEENKRLIEHALRGGASPGGERRGRGMNWVLIFPRTEQQPVEHERIPEAPASSGGPA